MFPKSGALIETDAHSRALFSISFGVPSKGALPSGSPHRVLSERDALLLEPPSSISQKFLVNEPTSRFPWDELRYPLSTEARVLCLLSATVSQMFLFHDHLQICGRFTNGNKITARHWARTVRGATQKFGEFKQRAPTGCRMPFRR
jgi:hypothetical protein